MITGFSELIEERRSTGRLIDADHGEPRAPAMAVSDLSAWYTERKKRIPVLSSINLPVPQNAITALIGPSGSGKSTLLRCLNRMHELKDGGLQGQVTLHGQDIYDPSVDPVSLRRDVGMIFQKAEPFFTDILGNVLAGRRFTGETMNRSEAHDVAEHYLTQVGLWDDVKDRLRQPATTLSGGQLQRLCIARALAVEPKIILMDEPCSALDPISTATIEDLMRELSQDYTLVVVTHNMQQAARVADLTAFMDKIPGEEQLGSTIIEYGPADQIFVHPANSRTEDYITGRFG